MSAAAPAKYLRIVDMPAALGGVTPADIIAEAAKCRIPVWFAVKDAIVADFKEIPLLPYMNEIAFAADTGPLEDRPKAQPVVFATCSGWAAIHESQPDAWAPLESSRQHAPEVQKLEALRLILTDPGNATVIAMKGAARVHRLAAFRCEGETRQWTDQGFVLPSWNAGSGWELSGTAKELHDRSMMHKIRGSTSLDDVIDDRGRSWQLVYRDELHLDAEGIKLLPKPWRKALKASKPRSKDCLPCGVTLEDLAALADPDSPHHAPELAAALELWAALRRRTGRTLPVMPPKIPSGKGPYSIYDLVSRYYRDTSKDSSERIARVVNCRKRGGALPTEGN